MLVFECSGDYTVMPQ